MASQPAFTHRKDPTVPVFPDTGLVAVMDAQCAICARGARWIARNDGLNQFRIVPQQSALGAALLSHYGMNPTDPTSWLLLDHGQPHTSLSAIIRTATRLGGIWRMLAVLRILPRPLQNWLYQRLARNRYRIAGHADLCSLPDPAVQQRLLQ